MAVIEDVLNGVDTTVASLGADIYNAVAGEVLPVVQVSSVLVLALTGANLALQAVPMTLANGMSLMLRIALVFIFVSTFGNFFAIYGVITDAPARFGAIVLEAVTAGTVTNLYEGLDQLYAQALNVGDAVSQNGSFIAGAIAGVVMFLVAALMATISIIVIAAAKLMVGVLIIISPVAIASTLFKQSAPFFEAYVKLALGFSLVPLLSAAMAGFTIATAEIVTPDNLSSVETIGDMVSFIVVMMLGAGLMLQVPSIASSLAQTGINLSAAAASTYMQGRSALKGGRAAGASLRGAGEAAMGRSLAPTASTARRAGYTSVSTVMNLASRMKR